MGIAAREDQPNTEGDLNVCHTSMLQLQLFAAEVCRINKCMPPGNRSHTPAVPLLVVPTARYLLSTFEALGT